MKLSKAIVKLRIPIVILALILMIPAVFGMLKTRINYDMLTYLPESMQGRVLVHYPGRYAR